MRNKLKSRFVHHLVLFLHDMLLHSKGTNHGGSAHAFIEIAVDGTPDSAAHLVQVIVSLSEVGHNFAEDETNDTEANGRLPEANGEH